MHWRVGCIDTQALGDHVTKFAGVRERLGDWTAAALCALQAGPLWRPT